MIGGLKIIDKNEVDDKIIAVLNSDPYWENVKNIKDFPEVYLSRISHYFLTYKLRPGESPRTKLETIYGQKHALDVIRAGAKDYKNHFTNN